MNTHVFMVSRDESVLDVSSNAALRMRQYGENGVQITIAVLAKSNKGKVSVELSPTVVVHGFSGGFLVRWISILFFGKKLVQRNWVVTSQDPFEAGLLGWLIARKSHAPLEIQIHGDFFGKYWRKEAWHRPMRLVFAKWLLKKASIVRVPSQRVRRSLSSIVVQENIVVIPVAGKESLPIVEGADVSHVTVLYAGRFTMEKNLSLLLRAFQKFHEAHPSSQLLLCGNGPLKLQIQKESEVLGLKDCVRFDEFKTNKCIQVSGRVIAALSSFHESWNRFVIEAANSGFPVVMTDVGCAGEIIENGVSGWVVPVDDETAFSDALICAERDEIESERRPVNAKARVEKLPSSEVIASAIRRVWQHMGSISEL